MAAFMEMRRLRTLITGMRLSPRRNFAVCLAVGIALYLAYALLRSSAEAEDLRPAFKDHGRWRTSHAVSPAVPVYLDRFSEHTIYTAVEDAYYRRLEGVHVRCSQLATIGRGWRVCASNAFRVRKPCLVYSFGVQHSWELEEHFAESFGCRVRAFDPSMAKESHIHSPGPVFFYNIGLGGRDQKRLGGWQMNTFNTLLQKFNDTQHTVDLVKLNIAYFEWEALESMLATGSLSRVKQIVAEVHTDGVKRKTTSRDDYVRYHKILDGVEKLGFRRCFRHEDYDGVERLSTNRNSAKDAILQRSGHLHRSCCHKLTYINMKFAKGGSGLEIL